MIRLCELCSQQVALVCFGPPTAQLMVGASQKDGVLWDGRLNKLPPGWRGPMPFVRVAAGKSFCAIRWAFLSPIEPVTAQEMLGDVLVQFFGPAQAQKAREMQQD